MDDDYSIIARNGALYVECHDPCQVLLNVCVICGKEGVKLSKCRDVKSWNTLYESQSHRYSFVIIRKGRFS